MRTVRLKDELKYRLDLLKARISRNGEGNITFSDLIKMILDKFEEANDD